MQASLSVSGCFVMINLSARCVTGSRGDGEGLEEEEGQLDGDSWVTALPQVSITATPAAELCNYAQWTQPGLLTAVTSAGNMFVTREESSILCQS